MKVVFEELTMEMLKKCPIGSILKHHHPGKRLFFLAVAEQAHEILVANFGQTRDLKPEYVFDAEMNAKCQSFYQKSK